MDSYDFRTIEPQWQDVWQRERTLSVRPPSDAPDVYILDMFPGPSGPLHMGHGKNYLIGDVIARYRIRRGDNVFHPMGWDAFGLPAEIAAIKHDVHPRDWTERHIAIQKRQFRSLGIHHDWDFEIDTSDPDYYRWNQWLFLKLHERGLAYQAERPVNWCPQCNTTLANEEVVAGACERCDAPVVQKPLRQWFLKITAYADALLQGLDDLPGWPERIKTMQRNWIGRSEGAEIRFAVPDANAHITAFTTRPDTLFGVTFIALAPDHPLAARYGRPLRPGETGVEIGPRAVHPVTGNAVPIWVADYVVTGYGTGAVMGVPAHDDRDFAFAQAHGLPIRRVIASKFDLPFAGHGPLIDSGPFTGRHSEKAAQNIAHWLQTRGGGGPAVTYKLRDWCISRQRYWGTPIPIVHCSACGAVPVPESDLPVRLPHMAAFIPDGKPPLARASGFVQTPCPMCGRPAQRECDTMTGFVCSSWYFLRFTSPASIHTPFDPEAVRRWLPVAHYIGGKEHAVGHLMYARFITRFLKDMDWVPFAEPFTHLFNQGVVCKDGAKMSKSRGNVVSIEHMVETCGADTARVFVLFATPPDRDMDWSDDGVDGIFRFLNRVWRAVTADVPGGSASPPDLTRAVHRTIRAVTTDIERLQNNTAISRLMELTTATQQAIDSGAPAADIEKARNALVALIAPFAPHIAEELWHRLGHTDSVHRAPWPTFDVERADEPTVTVTVQINGKIRDRIDLHRGVSQAEIEKVAKERTRVRDHLSGKNIRRTIYVPDRLLNFVVA